MRIEELISRIGATFPSVTVSPSVKKFNEDARARLEAATDPVSRAAVAAIKKHEAALAAQEEALRLRGKDMRYGDRERLEKAVAASADAIAAAVREAALVKLAALVKETAGAKEEWEYARTGSEKAIMRTRLAREESAARFGAMSDAEIEDVAGRYAHGAAELSFDDVDLIGRELRARGNGRMADLARTRAVAEDYGRPWMRQAHGEAAVHLGSYDVSTVPVLAEGENQSGVPVRFYEPVRIENLVRPPEASVAESIARVEAAVKGGKE